ncbi:MAG: ComEC/Rec2 family competence protein, partial [Chloroflexi bacterium]|nr:ComEC/Rec2 family competence protein [Chloroflexota bacterium]
MPTLFIFTAAFLAGIVSAGAMGIALPLELLLLAALVPLIALVLWWREPRGPLFFACGMLFLMGVARYQIAQNSSGDALTRYHDAAPVTLRGVVAAPPDVRDRSTDLRVDVSSLKTAQGWREARGTVLARLPRYEDSAYGDEVELSGVLHAPPVFSDFSYQDYLARQGVYSLIDRPRLIRIASGQGNPFYAALFALRERAQAIIEHSLPEPQASLLSGILLGQDRGIPADTVDAFNRTGTSHIIAISGYNITIVAGFLAAFGGMFVRRRHTWLFVVLGIAAYVVFVGASASVLRAGIMGILYVSATAFGRRSQALNTLMAAAFV